MSDNTLPTAAPQEHAFAPYVRILGKGKSGSRSLSLDEARHAFSLILRSEVEPLQLGAFLMLLRVKEETAEELAGFILACRDEMVCPPTDLAADLDWSSYAGKKHQHPWYVLAILLLAQSGLRVFVHGSAGTTPGRLYTEQVFRSLNLPIADGWAQVSQQLKTSSMSYLPLQQFCPALDSILHLRPLLGLRSPVNTLARLLNPLNSPFSLQSVFHPGYAQLHHQASLILKQPSALVFKGESGEAEIRPHADTQLNYLAGSKQLELSAKRTINQRVTAVAAPDVTPLVQLWRGENAENYGLQAVIATTAAVLTLHAPHLNESDATQQAMTLWQNRDTTRLDRCH
ncbi:MAG: anthranilate phosphoribosyltransferase [Halioglobus sp.]|jgi:anthranilate phosphoribosyltransferase